MFLLHRAIEKKLKAARLDLSAAEALTALKSVRVVDINLGDGTAKRSITTGTKPPKEWRPCTVAQPNPKPLYDIHNPIFVLYMFTCPIFSKNWV